MNKKEFKTDELKVQVASQVFSTVVEEEGYTLYESATLSVKLAEFIIDKCKTEIKPEVEEFANTQKIDKNQVTKN